MRILIDYRPALKERSGVGEYVHQLVRALAALPGRHDPEVGNPGPSGGNSDQVDIFSSSWKDRPSAEALDELGRVGLVDRRVPVKLLNLLWHQFEAPGIERLAGRRYDVVHSPHPLMLPSRQAARVVTIHDLDFLKHPERTAAEIRRDYARFAASHARRADAIIVPSQHVGALVRSELNVAAEQVSVCPHGVPRWSSSSPIVPGNPGGTYLLFLGTLEPRKNIPGLLSAYARLLARDPDTLPLVIAGGVSQAAAPWLAAMGQPPLAGHVQYRGYVQASGREELLRGARLLILPSFDEGFGLPVLEAMSLGIPVVAADRGALPEVTGGCAVLVDPDDPASISAGIQQVLDSTAASRQMAERGLARAAGFTWRQAAETTRRAYERAVERRRTRLPNADRD